MDLSKIKEFIAIRQELHELGVIGLDMYGDNIHLSKDCMVGMADLEIKFYGHDCRYPYEIFTYRDGINLHCICTKEELETYFPQFVDYLVEDVDLSGGADHDI